MAGVNSLMDIGRLGLFASQTAIQVTGDNIANVNTEGYARRSLRVEENISVDYVAGQLGSGVLAKEVVRHFDQWIENSYNDKATLRERWDTVYDGLQGVESLFNESNEFGISSTISKFFADWQNLADRPENFATREELLGDTKTMLNLIHQINSDLVKRQQEVDSYITQDVATVNTLLSDIAELNRQINMHEVAGQNNANEMRDERDRKVRELSGYLDTKYIDNGGGNVTILTKAGQTLVDGTSYYRLSYDAAQATNSLSVDSSFDGQVYFEGDDSKEYTIQVVSNAGGMAVSSGANAALFKVSLDGGRTWLQDEDGNTRYYAARPYGAKVSVGELSIWFGDPDDSSQTPLNDLTAGDKFTIVPKKGLYWHNTTSSKENITPQILSNGEDDGRRLTGGKLAGYFNFRDEYAGQYQTKMDALSKAMIWEVNRQHSQGAGLQKFTFVEGTYSVDGTSFALGSDASGLTFADKLTSGSTMVYMFNASTGTLVSGAALDFSDDPGQQNFNPSLHSLADVRDAFNRTFQGSLTASIVNNAIQLRSESGYSFQFGADSTGLTAALGLNTYFQGDGASNITLNSTVDQDADFVCAGHVNGGDEANSGDNITANNIAALQQRKVTISTVFEGATRQTLLEYYNTLVSRVGADTQDSAFNYKYQDALATDLDNRQQSIAGVNLDEEMANLIKYQHSYTAAAKLITTADQMMQTVLGMKQ